MKALTRVWHKLFRFWYDRTPGLGSMDEATDAIRRSESAVKAIRWDEEKIDPDLRYLHDTVHNNHFRVKVESAWRRRPVQ